MKSKSTVIHLAMLNDLFLHTGGGGGGRLFANILSLLPSLRCVLEKSLKVMVISELSEGQHRFC